MGKHKAYVVRDNVAGTVTEFEVTQDGTMSVVVLNFNSNSDSLATQFEERNNVNRNFVPTNVREVYPPDRKKTGYPRPSRHRSWKALKEQLLPKTFRAKSRR